MSEREETDLNHLRDIGFAAHHRVINADSDAEAVGWATGAVMGMVQNWAEASEARQRELWSEAAHASDALYERWRERIEALPVSKAGAK